MAKSRYASIGLEQKRDKVIATGYGRSARGQKYVMKFVEKICDPKDRESVRKAKDEAISELMAYVDVFG